MWCSGKGGLCVAGGLGFESRRPHSREIYVKKTGDGWALTGGGLHQLKKITFFLVKNLIFSGFFSVPTLPSVRPLPSVRHSAKPLPSARQKTLGKDVFAESFFTKCNSPSVTLGEQFAECFMPFAECLGHSANSTSPVVFVDSMMHHIIVSL